MISWIQRTFQHHFRLIFAVLLVGMVIPFIFTIGSTPGIGRADRTSAQREFFGHDLNSREQERILVGDTRLSAEMQYGSNASPDQIQYYMYQRVAAEHLADQLHLPHPTEPQVTEFIKGLRIFAGPDGQFDVSRYDAFRNSLKSESTVSEGDIARVISDDVRMSQLQHLLAGPGYVMPGDVREVLTKGDTTWTVSTATADYAAFSPELKLTDPEMTKFLADNSFRYTVAPRIVADYVAFPATLFMAGIAPTDAEVREYYDANPSLFPKPASPAKPPAPAKADPAADFAAVKTQVRQALILELARRSAVKAASDFTYALYEGKVTRSSLDSFLAAHQAKAQSLAPFTREVGPAELGGSKSVATAAFELTADKFYSEGISVPTGAVVLIWKDLLPSREPALAEIREKVRTDALDNLKRIRFVEFGRSLKAGIERRLKSGEPFDKAAVESAGAAKVAVKTYPPFSMREQPHDVDPSVYTALDGLAKGTVSDMEITADKGVLVYAADKKQPAVDPSNPHYVQIRSQLASAFARADAGALMREVVESELKRSNVEPK